MTKFKKIILAVFVLMNVAVLLGQLWPEGAPPFARNVNIAFLSLTLVYFLFLLVRKSG